MSCPSIVLEVHQHCKLHGAHRAVFIALAAYVDAYGPPVFPSLRTLAITADISERHAQRCLHALEQQGYLAITRRKEPGKNARNLYTVLFPWRVPAQKSTDTMPKLPAQKSTDIRCPWKILKDKEREKRSGSADMPRNIPPEVLAYPNTPDLVQRYLTPGSELYVAALSDYTPASSPETPYEVFPTIINGCELRFYLEPDSDRVRQAAKLAARQALYADVRHPIVQAGPGRGVGSRCSVAISSTGDYMATMPLDQQKGRDGD
jgi:Helix-turn-helix domain